MDSPVHLRWTSAVAFTFLFIVGVARATTFTVINANDNGVGSLRAAIVRANTNAGLDFILFNIPGSNVHTITPVTPLPAITERVIINGYSQPGSSANTSSNDIQRDLLIVLDGSAISGDGLEIQAGSSTIRGLQIINCNGAGIALVAGGGNIVAGNFIGSNTDGVRIRNSISNSVGGTTPQARNLISGNSSNGVLIQGIEASRNIVQGNFIGTDSSGTSSLGNGFAGVMITNAPNNRVGERVTAARNVISANGVGVGGAGIIISGPSATNNVVQGNFIGTDLTADHALGNETGILIEQDAARNLIGGTNDAGRNIISASFFAGVHLSGSSGNRVQANYVGLNRVGNAALGNALAGVLIEGAASNNVIGGVLTGAGNVIGGNGDGIHGGVALRTGALKNFVQGNFIGTDSSGIIALGNLGSGVLLSNAPLNVVGGSVAAAENVIAFNWSNGVSVSASVGIDLRTSTMFSNQGLGIDLGSDGVTPNDPCDPDSGPNNLRNFPVLTSAVSTATAIIIQGTLNSTSNASFQIEFFSNSECDPSTFGEGEMLIGSTNVMTGPDCTVDFEVTLPIAVPAGEFITARATSFPPVGSRQTSEFSQCVEVTTPQTVSLIATDPNAREPAKGGRFRLSRSGSTAEPLTVIYTVAGSATPGIDYSNLTGVATIRAGFATEAIPVRTIDDDLLECTETVIATLSPGTNYSIGSANSATVVIKDNELPTVTVSATDPDASEPGSDNGMFTITRTGCVDAPLNVVFSKSGTAAAGVDYRNFAASIIPGGRASRTIVVRPFNDAAAEGPETVILTLTSQPTYVIGDPGEATVTITDDE